MVVLNDRGEFVDIQGLVHSEELRDVFVADGTVLLFRENDDTRSDECVLEGLTVEFEHCIDREIVEDELLKVLSIPRV